MTAKRASGTATRMSVEVSISKPPATQVPFTAATIGLYVSRSAPVQKSRPTPVMTATRARASSRNAAQALGQIAEMPANYVSRAG